MSNFVIRPLTALKELESVEALQRLVWDDPSTVVYKHMLISFVRNGGSIIGALDGDNVVGFVLSYLGMESPEAERPAMANLKLVSQRMAVLPEYRNTGIGYDLKLAQRQYAIKQGIRLITWTFDPLLSRNAHLNVRKLGGIVREYERDLYGTANSPLVSLGSSDRVIVEWWVTNNRVEQRISGKRGALSLSQYTDANATILNPTQEGPKGYLQPGGRVIEPQSHVALLEIPDNYQSMARDEPEIAKTWRQHTRDILQELFGAGYVITDFVRGEHGTDERTRCFYALSYGDAMLSRFSTN
jgi:predicted GNAT superfamily acetyltransferase